MRNMNRSNWVILIKTWMLMKPKIWKNPLLTSCTLFQSKIHSNIFLILKMTKIFWKYVQLLQFSPAGLQQHHHYLLQHTQLNHQEMQVLPVMLQTCQQQGPHIQQIQQLHHLASGDLSRLETKLPPSRSSETFGSVNFVSKPITDRTPLTKFITHLDTRRKLEQANYPPFWHSVGGSGIFFYFSGILLFC